MNEKPLILAVDDEPSNLMLISAALENDFKLALAKSAALAEQFLKRKKPSLILLDIKMPDKDGITFAEELMENQETFSIPFVFITGATDSETHRKARNLGALGFIEKPFSADGLRSYIEAVFRDKI